MYTIWFRFVDQAPGTETRIEVGKPDIIQTDVTEPLRAAQAVWDEMNLRSDTLMLSQRP